MFAATIYQRLLPRRYRGGIVCAFWALLLAGGLCLVPDFGVSYDEDIQRLSGQVSLLYVFQQLPASWQARLLTPEAAAHIAAEGGGRQLATYPDRDYGVVFELPASALEQALRLRELRAVYLLRHTLNWLVCLGGLGAFYWLVARRFASWRFGLLGVGCLVLSPRQFADYFYNDKDAVFLALFTLALATTVAFVRRPTWRAAGWHALACAGAIGVRLMGVLLPVLTLALLASRAALGAYRGRRLAGPVGAYVGLLPALVVGCWPYLWANPWGNFVAAWHAMSRFRWVGSVLYQGQHLKATALPWHYALVWIGITVPLVYLLCWLVGVGALSHQVARWGRHTLVRATGWQDLLFLACCVLPLAAVIGLHSVLYNGWRQLYFLYPALLLVSLRGLVAAWHWQPPGVRPRAWQAGLGAGGALALAVVAGRMGQLHPLENVYFNALAPAPIERSFEGDYWELSYYPAFRWLLQHDSRAHLRLHTDLLQRLNYDLLPAADRQRLELVGNPADADYLLYKNAAAWASPHVPPTYTVRAGAVRLLHFYRLR